VKYPGYFGTKYLLFVMIRRITRTDLMSKQEYHKEYGIPRPTIDKLIKDGKLIVEHISGTDYIKIK
jgi:hypothetical protein